MGVVPVRYCRTKAPLASKSRTDTGWLPKDERSSHANPTAGLGNSCRAGAEASVTFLVGPASVGVGRLPPHCTVMAKVHSVVWPLVATARQVFTVVPAGKLDPVDRPLTKKGVSWPEQLSDAVGAG